MATNMLIRGSFLSIKGYFMLYVHTRLTTTEWIIYRISLEVGSLNELGLALIPYYFSIKDFMESRPINCNTWSYVIYVGQGYLVNHIVFTKFAMVITCVS